MAEEDLQIRKVFIGHYRAKRSLEFMDAYDGKQAWHKLQGILRRRRLKRRIAYTSSVAAAVGLIIGSIWVWRPDSASSFGERLAMQQDSVRIEKSAGVILSLADGRKVDLSCEEGMLAGEYINNDPQQKRLSYMAGADSGQCAGFNRLEVPRGTDYRLVLSDGSRVWVNAKSRLTYPECFGDVREIQLEGEAYFEVARDEKRPFVVRTARMKVKVLGTEFNMNTRDSENVQTVLVKGQVEVAGDGDRRVLLRPGELAEMQPAGVRVTKVNTRKYTAWHEGVFYFEEATLEEIMQELSDWYYVEVVFGTHSLRMRKFSGILKRDEAIETVLKKIGQAAGVQFVVQDGIVYVK